jgi:hypothetical protein
MTNQDRICSVTWCDRPHRAQGYCRTHYERHRKGLDIETPLRQYEQGPRICKVEGCDRPRDTHGTYCPMHYSRLAKHGETGDVESTKKVASRTAGLPRLKRSKNGSSTWNTPEYRRAYRLLLDYKLTPSQLLALIDAQSNECAICRVQLVSEGTDPLVVREFAIDHDHATGDVRGLLCKGCNTALGLFRDNREFLSRAIWYLTPTSELSVEQRAIIVAD